MVSSFSENFSETDSWHHRPTSHRPGNSGTPLPGITSRIPKQDGRAEESGELLVSGCDAGLCE